MSTENEVSKTIDRVRQSIDKGKYDRALSDLLHLSEKYPDAGEIRPEIAEVFLRRGESRVRKGKMKEAHDDFERSLRWAEFPDTYVQLGRAALDSGNLDLAHKHLNQAIEIDDRFGPAHEALGYLFLQWNELSEATRAFEEALSCDHSSVDLYRAVRNAYMGLEKMGRAHELILEGLDVYPKDDRLQLAAGNSFVYAEGDSAGAEPYWRKAIELNPKNMDALFQLSALQASRGNREDALGLLSRCAEVDFDDARKLWKEDKELPFRRFAEYENDPDFVELLGR